MTVAVEPVNDADRMRWAESGLGRLTDLGVVPERIWIDAVALPWGEAVEAGDPLRAFLAEARRRWPRCRRLVGLSNLSWGCPDRAGIHRRWLPGLLEAGLDTLILDPLETGLVDLARRPR